MREIETTATYEKVMDDTTNIINQHCKYFSRNISMCHHNISAYLNFIGSPSFINSLMVQGLLQRHINVPLNLYLDYLLAPLN